MIKIKLSKDELRLTNPETNYKYNPLKKNQEDNFIFDYLNDKRLKIDLPTGIGLHRNLGQYSYFKNPLYLSYR